MQIKQGYENITSDKYKYYLNGISYPRVSSILENIDKKPLIKWAVKLACEKIDELIEPHLDLQDKRFYFDCHTKEAILEHGKNEHIRQFEEAQEYGSFVHDKIECWLKKCEEPKKNYPADWIEPAEKSLQGFIDFWKKGKFELIKSEMAVMNKELKYGGRIDILAKQCDEIVLLDIKTGKSIWKSAKVQCALYAIALDNMWDNNHPKYCPEFDCISKAIICHIPKIKPVLKGIILEGKEFDACKKAGLALVDLYYSLQEIK